MGDRDGLIEIYAQLAEAMVSAGHSPQRASITIRMIDTLALGTAMVSSSSPANWNDTSPGGRALLEAAETWDDDRDQTTAAFEMSLRFILAGLEAELYAPTPSSAKPGAPGTDASSRCV